MPEAQIDTPNSSVNVPALTRKATKPATTSNRPPAKRARTDSKVRKPVAPGPTKTEQVLQLLQRAKGASMADLMKVTGWQAHSIRGFLSGTVKKKMGLALTSEIDGKGARRYRVAKDRAA